MRNGMATIFRLMTAIMFSAVAMATPSATGPERLGVREIQPKPSAPAPFLSRPVSIARDDEAVYVLDSGDADIKIYGRDGSFLRQIGRKGQGPGEFRLPNDMDVFDGRIYVADSANRRVQILDRRGKLLGGFGLVMTPWRILVLDEERILVAGLPSGRKRGEKLISCLRRDGTSLWQAVDPLQSGDPVYDSLRNQLFIRRSPGGGFSLIRSFDDRLIKMMNADGFRKGEAAVPETDMPFKDIALPTASGRKKMLRGFCWSCAADGERLYLLSPEYTEDHDLGAGNAIVVLDEARKVEALIDLPERVTKFAVAGDTIYAVDTDARLRLFRFDTH